MASQHIPLWHLGTDSTAPTSCLKLSFCLLYSVKERSEKPLLAPPLHTQTLPPMEPLWSPGWGWKRGKCQRWAGDMLLLLCYSITNLPPSLRGHHWPPELELRLTSFRWLIRGKAPLEITINEHHLTSLDIWLSTELIISPYTGTVSLITCAFSSVLKELSRDPKKCSWKHLPSH